MDVEPALNEDDAIIINDDIEIILDDLQESDYLVPEEETDKEGSEQTFGYNLQANEDGTLKFPETSLTKDLIRSGLSHVARTLDTFEFAYSRYDGRNKNLTDVTVLGEYIHLRVLDLSSNRLKSIKCLAPVRHLLVLNVNDNQISSIEEIPEFLFLQALNVKGNGLTDVDGMFCNSLTYAQFSSNQIRNLSKFDAYVFPCLTVLELRANSLESLEGLNIPTLTRLYVAQNKLTNLSGLENCVNLTHLHARDNKISKLEGFPALEQLEYVNLRHNELKRYTQTKLLGNSPNIRTLIAMENPIASLEDYKVEMIATNQHLKRLDKQPVTEIDAVQGRQINTGREKGVVSPVADDTEAMTPPMPSIAEDDDEEEEDGFIEDFKDNNQEPKIQSKSLPQEPKLKGLKVKRGSGSAAK